MTAERSPEPSLPFRLFDDKADVAAVERDNEDESNANSNRAEQNSGSPGERKPRGRIVTDKDAGWITPTAFVAPITMVPIDPPRPATKRRRRHR